VTSTADIRVRADGSIDVEAAGDVRVKAAGTVTVEGASVEVSGESIALKGPVKILGDLSVGGTINGKRL
jgi:phage baseplate assembly protein gpV